MHFVDTVMASTSLGDRRGQRWQEMLAIPKENRSMYFTLNKFRHQLMLGELVITHEWYCSMFCPSSFDSIFIYTTDVQGFAYDDCQSFPRVIN